MIICEVDKCAMLVKRRWFFCDAKRWVFAYSVKTVLRSVNLGSFKLIQVMLVALLTSAFLGARGVLAGRYPENLFLMQSGIFTNAWYYRHQSLTFKLANLLQCTMNCHSGQHLRLFKLSRIALIHNWSFRENASASVPPTAILWSSSPKVTFHMKH